MVITQGDIFWADLGLPHGSEAGFERPVLVVQGNQLNRSRLSTVVCLPLTSNLKWAEAPGNVMLPSAITGLPKDSVANASQIVAVDRSVLASLVGHLPEPLLSVVLAGIDVVLGRAPVALPGDTTSSTAGSRMSHRRFARRRATGR